MKPPWYLHPALWAFGMYLLVIATCAVVAVLLDLRYDRIVAHSTLFIVLREMFDGDDR